MPPKRYKAHYERLRAANIDDWAAATALMLKEQQKIPDLARLA